MLASRLLSILMLLQARGPMTARALAQAFEVSIRTIHRDIDQLSAAGIPVYAERGREGGFRLAETYRTTLTGLTAAEAESLFLAGLPGPAADLGLADLLAAARLKLLAALPSGGEADRIATRFHLDPTGWFAAHDPPALLPQLARAVWTDRMLAIRYRRDGAIHDRVLGPLGLVLKGGIWYLVAASGAARRTYRVGNIAEVAVLDERFARPADFDLPAYWAASTRDFEIATYHGLARLRVSPRGRGLLERLGPYVTQSAAATADAPDAAGWVCCTIPFESVASGARDLLRLGEEAEVLAPPDLRAAIRAQLRAIARLYEA